MLAGGGYDLGLLLDGDADRAGAADERGTFIHQLQVTGLLMYYLAEHRGWRDPVVISVNNTSMARTPRAALRDRRPRDPGRVQVHRSEDDRDRGDDGRRGIGRVRVRDAPAGARRDLRRPPPARPVPAREGRRPMAGVEGDRALPRVAGPSFYRRIDVHVDRPTMPTTKRRLLVDLQAKSPSKLAGRAVTRTVPLSTTTASSSSSTTARGCSSGRRARSRWSASTPRRRPRRPARRCWRPANRWCAAHERRARGLRGELDRTPGRQALGPRADLGPDRPLLREDPRHRGGATPVAPAACREG